VFARIALIESVLAWKVQRDNMKLFAKSEKEPRKVCIGRNTLKVTLFRKNNWVVQELLQDVHRVDIRVSVEESFWGDQSFEKEQAQKRECVEILQ
jgi:hypothetical protein